MVREVSVRKSVPSDAYVVSVFFLVLETIPSDICVLKLFWFSFFLSEEVCWSVFAFINVRWLLNPRYSFKATCLICAVGPSPPFALLQDLAFLEAP